MSTTMIIALVVTYNFPYRQSHRSVSLFYFPPMDLSPLDNRWRCTWTLLHANISVIAFFLLNLSFSIAFPKASFPYGFWLFQRITCFVYMQIKEVCYALYTFTISVCHYTWNTNMSGVKLKVNTLPGRLNASYCFWLVDFLFCSTKFPH